MEEQKTGGEPMKRVLTVNLNIEIVTQLEELANSGILPFEDLDEELLWKIKDLPVEEALAVLKEFMDSVLDHVSNRNAYLKAIINTFRRRTITGEIVVASNGPDEEKIRALLDRTGYALDITANQRKLFGPPPNWEQSPPGSVCEMDPLTGSNRGYAFITYCNREAAQVAINQLNNYEIRSGNCLKVCISVTNLRLFVSNIPKSKTKEEIFEEFSKLTDGLESTILIVINDYRYTLLKYKSHMHALRAKMKLHLRRTTVWHRNVFVVWAFPEEIQNFRASPNDDCKMVWNLSEVALSNFDRLISLFFCADNKTGRRNSDFKLVMQNVHVSLHRMFKIWAQFGWGRNMDWLKFQNLKMWLKNTEVFGPIRDDIVYEFHSSYTKPGAAGVTLFELVILLNDLSNRLGLKYNVENIIHDLIFANKPPYLSGTIKMIDE